MIVSTYAAGVVNPIMALIPESIIIFPVTLVLGSIPEKHIEVLTKIAIISLSLITGRFAEQESSASLITTIPNAEALKLLEFNVENNPVVTPSLNVLLLYCKINWLLELDIISDDWSIFTGSEPAMVETKKVSWWEKSIYC